MLFFRACVETIDETLTPATWAPHLTDTLTAHDVACSGKDMTLPEHIVGIGAVIAARLRALDACDDIPEEQEPTLQAYAAGATIASMIDATTYSEGQAPGRALTKDQR